jgi:hypothetical protein
LGKTTKNNSSYLLYQAQGTKVSRYLLLLLRFLRLQRFGNRQCKLSFVEWKKIIKLDEKKFKEKKRKLVHYGSIVAVINSLS